MNEVIRIVPVVLFILVGIICGVMAFKNLSSKQYLPFHEQATKKKWTELDSSLQTLILSLMRLIGFGFLIVALLLIVCPVVNYFIPNLFYKFAVPTFALIFCAGLFLTNYQLYRRTGSKTPWKGSIYAMLILIAGMIVSIFG